MSFGFRGYFGVPRLLAWFSFRCYFGLAVRLRFWCSVGLACAASLPSFCTELLVRVAVVMTVLGLARCYSFALRCAVFCWRSFMVRRAVVAF